MAENIFIFGAGASKDGGTPLMSEFIEKAIDLSSKYKETDPTFFASVLEVLDARSHLRKAQINSTLDLDNVEDIFGALEMAKLLGGIGNEVTEEELSKYHSSITTMIIKTIEYSSEYTHNDDCNVESPTNYKTLISSLCNEYSAYLKNSAFITFNYDTFIDFAIELNKDRYRLSDDKKNSDCGTTKSLYYGFGNKPPWAIKLYKLHGSINWGICPECGNLKKFDLQNDSDTLNLTVNTFGKKSQGKRFRYYSKVRNTICENCKQATGNEISLEPAIVPPTWMKGEKQEAFRKIWSAAMKEMLDAKRIYIIGYSFPKSDSFFHYFFALSTLNSKSDLREFNIFNPASDNDIVERFKSLAGPSFQKKFQYHPIGFSKLSFHNQALTTRDDIVYFDYWGKKVNVKNGL